MKELFGAKKRPWLLLVLGFSAAAFLVRWAGFTIPVLGTNINFDPREVFVTLGAAITGPLGAVVIAFFAGFSTGFLTVMAAHIAGSSHPFGLDNLEEKKIVCMPDVRSPKIC